MTRRKEQPDKALDLAIRTVDSVWNTSATYEDHVRALAAALRGYAREYGLDYFRKKGAKGGRIGGRKRAENMTAAQRSESARKAVNARWSKRK